MPQISGEGHKKMFAPRKSSVDGLILHNPAIPFYRCDISCSHHLRYAWVIKRESSHSAKNRAHLSIQSWPYSHQSSVCLCHPLYM